MYRIRPNYRTVCLGFSKALGKLAVKYPPNKDSSTEDFMRSIFTDAYAILFSVFFIEAYVVDTRYSIQMSTHNICFCKEVDKSTLVVIF